MLNPRTLTTLKYMQRRLDMNVNAYHAVDLANGVGSIIVSISLNAVIQRTSKCSTI